MPPMGDIERSNFVFVSRGCVGSSSRRATFFHGLAYFRMTYQSGPRSYEQVFGWRNLKRSDLNLLERSEVRTVFVLVLVNVCYWTRSKNEVCRLCADLNLARSVDGDSHGVEIKVVLWVVTCPGFQRWNVWWRLLTSGDVWWSLVTSGDVWWRILMFHIGHDLLNWVNL